MANLTIQDDEFGRVSYADEVVATIAGLAATEIEGVYQLVGGFDGKGRERGSRKTIGKGVKVQMTENEAIIDIYIVVDFGVQIRELAEKAQDNIKKNIETMTGLLVPEVNIHISGIRMTKEE